MNLEQIQKLIADAQNSASLVATPQGAAAVTASTNPVQNLPAAYAPTTVDEVQLVARDMTLDDLSVGSMIVDGWLKTTAFGLCIDDDPKIFETIPVSINIADIKVKKAVRWNVNTVPNYAASYDNGVTEVRSGRAWPQVVREAKRLDPRSFEYVTVDLPLIILEPLELKKSPTLPAGSTLGHVPSSTGVAGVREFINKVRKTHGNTSVVGKISCERKEKKEVNPWGVISFGDFQTWKAV
jgi:hypothetical protein